jgi:Restriction endonuclease
VAVPTGRLPGEAYVTGKAGDLGADVKAVTPDGRVLIIQAKRYVMGNMVSSPDLQKFGGTCYKVHQAQVAAVVTTSGSPSTPGSMRPPVGSSCSITTPSRAGQLATGRRRGSLSLHPRARSHCRSKSPEAETRAGHQHDNEVAAIGTAAVMAARRSATRCLEGLYAQRVSLPVRR